MGIGRRGDPTLFEARMLVAQRLEARSGGVLTISSDNRDDFGRVKLEGTRILDTERFVPRESIDRFYWDMPYHLVPSGVPHAATCNRPAKETGLSLVKLQRFITAFSSRLA